MLRIQRIPYERKFRNENCSAARNVPEMESMNILDNKMILRQKKVESITVIVKIICNLNQPLEVFTGCSGGDRGELDFEGNTNKRVGFNYVICVARAPRKFRAYT